MTILLPVCRFWLFGVIQTVGNEAWVMSTVAQQVSGRGSNGARTGGHGVARVDSDHAECEGVSIDSAVRGFRQPLYPGAVIQYESENISCPMALWFVAFSGIVAWVEPGYWPAALRNLTRGI